jgi:exopolysaccharide biosynthesis WecB/TagA/CpsF family protein
MANVPEGLLAQHALSYRDILGLHVVAAHGDDVVREIDDRIAQQESIRLAFVNAHGSNIAAKDDAYRDALNSFMLLNDGIGLDIAARVLTGSPFPENLNGSDFVPRYLHDTRHRFRIALLGSAPGVAETAAEVLSKNCPQHTIASARDGYFSDRESAGVAEDIRSAQADLLLVGLGNPKQELWIARHLEATGCKVAIGVGALFDFLAARVPRAPTLIRRMRLEWMFRLALEPVRLGRRYLVGNPVFLARVMSESMKAGTRRSPSQAGGGYDSSTD